VAIALYYRHVKKKIARGWGAGTPLGRASPGRRGEGRFGAPCSLKTEQLTPRKAWHATQVPGGPPLPTVRCQGTERGASSPTRCAARARAGGRRPPGGPPARGPTVGNRSPGRKPAGCSPGPPARGPALPPFQLLKDFSFTLLLGRSDSAEGSLGVLGHS
jgi:hypothetical protein